MLNQTECRCDYSNRANNDIHFISWIDFDLLGWTYRDTDPNLPATPKKEADRPKNLIYR